MKINDKEFFTLKDIAEKTGKEYGAVRTALSRAGIEPIFTGALYDQTAFNFIKNAPPPGRPRKKPEPAKPK